MCFIRLNCCRVKFLIMFLLTYSALTHAEGFPRVDWREDLIPINGQLLAGDFHLDSVYGRRGLGDEAGKLVWLYFGYTACPDVCPTSMATMRAAFESLEPKIRLQVRVLFVTVDPSRDTLPELQTYLDAFALPGIAMTGRHEQIEAVAYRYGVQYSQVELPESAMGYAMDHSSAIYLIDRRGRLRFVFRHGGDPKVLAGLTALLVQDSSIR